MACSGQENEMSEQISSEDRKHSLNDGASAQQRCHQCFSDIHAALRELTATVTEQKANIRALETRLREELNKKTEEMSNLTQSELEKLRKEITDREIAFSAALTKSGGGNVGPFTTDITLVYKNVFTNIGNAYNPITGIFTAPLKGAYMFRISVYSPASQSTPSTVYMKKNGNNVIVAHGHQDQFAVNASNGAVLVLDAGDVVYVTLCSSRMIFDNESNHSTFSGYLLFPLRG
ncbi:cerebellin-4-like [Puntigrus tetrazona]|uniref:cerebellin-4-like n=1 Tax=Puntigrus tetrazona TaxID=1606681 RepID=UPI001C8B08F9|nr:cerebellin-4-like [Puntigrus tetrazona]XP_043108004.1 cerebellin-4-like [Puntigrus tetrazona]